MQETQQQQAITSNNLHYTGATALQVRLNTDNLLNQIKQFLEGKIRILENDAKGKFTFTEIKTGKPKANSLGVQAIISRIQLILNPAYVQGNFDIDRYTREIQQFRMTLSEELMINIHRYDISEYDYCGIIDTIMHLTKGFVSRLIDNKERESYEATMRHVETNTTREQQKRGL